MSIRIVLADDHVIVRDGLRSLLEQHPDMEIVAEAADGLAAVQVVGDTQPDVVVIDASMTNLNGGEATRRIRAKLPEVQVICLSMHSESRFVSAMLEAGASGYLLKDCASEELIRAVHTVLAGQEYISPGVGQVVADHFKVGHAEPIPSAYSVLTDKESQVLQLLAEGHSTKEIGARLNVSAKTIASHREHIMHKLGISSIAGLTKYAVQQGLTPLERQPAALRSAAWHHKFSILAPQIQHFIDRTAARNRLRCITALARGHVSGHDIFERSYARVVQSFRPYLR